MPSWTSKALSAILLAAAAAADRPPPRFTIDLSLPPKDRWTHIVSDPFYNASLWNTIALVGEEDPLYKVLLGIAAEIPFQNLTGWLPPDQAEEALAIAAVTGLPLGLLWAMNSLYDITAGQVFDHAFCTSIVAQDAGGKVFHGRNLDYPVRDAMQNLTLTLDWQDASGEVMFTSVSILGQTGFNTVQRAGGWALTHDERDKGPDRENWVDHFLRRRVVTFSLFREMAEQQATFEGALAMAEAVDLAAPSYIIMSGVRAGEGALVTRGRDAAGNATDVVRLGDDGGWYLLETNYDHDEPPSPTDDRRDVATRALQRSGQDGAASVDGLLAILSDTGHCNSTAGERPLENEMTLYTWAASAAAPGEL
eukprot:CAMPEP_0119292054 /NCGR_PEP_ID=MMETSP1329-20130426/43462_1 /TAXON_ID=114041 /ORGANISM="Genus nov. species nov., Strain RCC1024" /LENGTH=364 /DNA_ID=CAMNT_0007292883 /DNA_START=57 /DNA_END=1147 /DNA_ORIENTATION=-